MSTINIIVICLLDIRNFIYNNSYYNYNYKLFIIFTMFPLVWCRYLQYFLLFGADIYNISSCLVPIFILTRNMSGVNECLVSIYTYICFCCLFPSCLVSIFIVVSLQDLL